MQRQRVDDALLPQRRLEVVHVGVRFQAQGAGLYVKPRKTGEVLQSVERLAQVGVGELATLAGPQQCGQFGPWRRLVYASWPLWPGHSSAASSARATQLRLSAR